MTSTLKFRLMMTLIFIGVIPALVVGSGAFYISSKSLEEYVFAKLTSTRDVMKTRIDGYFDSARKDILLLADSKDVQDLYKTAKVYKKHEEIKGSAAFNTDTYEYQEILATKGGSLKNLVTHKGYANVLLVAADSGHVVYSAEQNEDFGTSLALQSSSNSPLVSVWRNVVADKAIFYQDYATYSAQNNQVVAFIGAPVFNLKRDVVAVVVLQISNKIINGITGQRSGMGQTGESYLVGTDRLMRSDSYLAPNKFSVANAFAEPALSVVRSQAIEQALLGQSGTEIINSYLDTQVLTAYTSIQFGNHTWALVSELSEDEAFAAIDTMKYILFIILAIVIALVTIAAIYISGSITSPVKKMTGFLNELALGHIDKRTQLSRKDEIGQMANSLDNLANYLEYDLVKGLQNIAEGDLSQPITPKDANDVISHALIETNSDLTNIVDDISGYTNNLVVQSDKILSSSDNISASSEYAQQALESISTSLLEVGRVTDNTAEKTVSADRLGASAAKSAAMGKSQVEEAVAAMEEIKAATDNISSILVAIENIADQTNLLALNAAIEAARAGDAGRGFAVVADEVRTLASQSTQAATETADLVKVVVDKTHVGTNITLTSAQSLTEIVEAVEQVSDIIGDISRSATEQSSAVSEANENLIKIADVNKQTSESAQQGLEVSQELASFSSGLKDIVAKFTLKH